MNPVAPLHSDGRHKHLDFDAAAQGNAKKRRHKVRVSAAAIDVSRFKHHVAGYRLLLEQELLEKQIIEYLFDADDSS